MPESVVSWGQIALYSAGAVYLLILSIVHLFKNMDKTYGNIISTLQAQVVLADTKATNLHSQVLMGIETVRKLGEKVEKADKDCAEKLHAQELKLTDSVAKVAERVASLEGSSVVAPTATAVTDKLDAVDRHVKANTDNVMGLRKELKERTEANEEKNK